MVKSAAFLYSVPRCTATLAPSQLHREVCSHLQLWSKKQSYWSPGICDDRRQVGRDDSPTVWEEGENIYSCAVLFVHRMQLWVRLMGSKCNCTKFQNYTEEIHIQDEATGSGEQVKFLIWTWFINTRSFINQWWKASAHSL